MDDVIIKLGTISESLIRVEGKVDAIQQTVGLHDAVLFGEGRDKQGGLVRSINTFEITVKGIWRMVRWALILVAAMFLLRLPQNVKEVVAIVSHWFM